MYNYSPTYLCFGVVLGGLLQLLLNYIVFYKSTLSFGAVTQGSWELIRRVMTRFLPCILGISIVEINLFVSGMIASFLPKGSISLLYYGSRFMNIPLGVFGVALSNILLPHFSRVVLYAPRRFDFYLLEVAKLVTWVIVPVALIMMYVAKELFSVVFLFAHTVSPDHVIQAQWILIAYCSGLVLFCFNKILLSMFYALKDTRSTTITSIVGALINMTGDIIGLYYGSVVGIALAAVASALGSALLSCYFLMTKHAVHFYWHRYLLFVRAFIVQLAVAMTGFVLLQYGISAVFTHLLPISYGYMLLNYWVSVGFSFIIACCALYYSRAIVGIKLYFLR